MSRSIKSEVALYNKYYRDDGFTMSDETLAEFFEVVEEALDVLRDGRSVFSRETRAAYVNDLRAKVARGDEQFKPFMTRLLQGEPASG